MPETRPPADFDSSSLAALAARLEETGSPPPVEQWDPPHCGDSEMVITADGTWLHQGRPITRPAMVRLFASVLRREDDGSYVLVTPVEKLAITVERTPFRAVAMKSEGEGKDRTLAFRLDTGETVIAGPDHPLRIEATPEGPSPRLLVRGRLEAEIARPVYYELAELALAEGADPPGIWSDGAFFALA
ncbi:DUF1285 domain-containing protein [Sphingomicrobium astaxanthinifaciens]|uniref:DUF1285 domain-containing protein n=1 Tax=Sphingomicrobium astaxanthinifaciens TaxID=1227949 RepID=UPI001FCC8F1A|nr:DUF1285 domain-containing protein [Sphingomicrobium astaxanthinifaciens]MCJ7420565.1 DUF1285 domain-containing protein [Sphingomicrobium astaxanthinifaciens]